MITNRIREALYRLLEDAAEWRIIAKRERIHTYDEDSREVIAWLAEVGNLPRVEPMKIANAGDKTPNGDSYPMVDPHYVGSREHTNELLNDLMEAFAIARSDNLTDEQLAYTVLELFKLEFYIAQLAELWGWEGTDVSAERSAKMSLLSALRSMQEQRKRRKCGHKYLTNDYICYLCGERKDNDGCRVENIVDRAVAEGAWNRSTHS